MTPFSAFIVAWFAWVMSWVLAAVWQDNTEAGPGVRAELPYRVVTVIGVALLFWGFRLPGHGLRLWSTPDVVGWLLFVVELVGFGVCWWARLYLGRLWSGAVTLKTDHRVVDTGPYRLVRHPIYSGLLLSALATALTFGLLSGLVGFVVLIFAFCIKARLEERFLRAELGAKAYDAYAARVGMLVPKL